MLTDLIKAIRAGWMYGRKVYRTRRMVRAESARRIAEFDDAF